MKLKTLNTHLCFILLVLIIFFTIIIRVRLLDVPLERDEGEYAYMGQLILDGIPPYSEAYNMKFPGIYFIYAGILWLFGETHTAIHFSLLIVNVLSIILLYFFSYKAYDNWIAAASAAAFALLSLSYHVQGFWANAEHFILPFVISANILLLLGNKEKKIGYILFSGIMFGCATLVKQHGAFFGFLGFFALVIFLLQNKSIDREIRLKYIFTFIAGFIFPLVLCILYLSHAGVIRNFYIWTFKYAKEYSSIVSLEDIKFNFIGGFQSIWYFALLIWILAGVGLIALFSQKFNKESNIIVLCLFFAGWIALSVGFYFRPHYFILILPAAALLFGIGIRFIFKIFSTSSSFILHYFPPIFIAVMAVISTIAAHWDVLIQFSPEKAVQVVYGGSPFLPSSRIAELIKLETTENDRIAIIGNEPQLLFYSQRKSATSFIYFFSITEEQPLAEQFRFEMIRQIESVAPRLLVYTQVMPESYGKSESEVELNKWFTHFSQSRYIPIARFEYENINNVLLITDPALLQNKSARKFWITIYKKKDT